VQTRGGKIGDTGEDVGEPGLKIDVVEAMKLIWRRMKIVIESSSALPLAAILSQSEVFCGKRVGVILSGGNVDLDKSPWMRS
jgi:threonine dehydratase